MKLFLKFICFGSLMRPFDQLYVMYINWWMIGLIELISCRISLPSFPGFPEVEVRAYVPRDRAGPYYGHVHILHAPPFRQNPFAPHTDNSCSIGLSFCQQHPSCKKNGAPKSGFSKTKTKIGDHFSIKFLKYIPNNLHSTGQTFNPLLANYFQVFLLHYNLAAFPLYFPLKKRHVERNQEM